MSDVGREAHLEQNAASAKREFLIAAPAIMEQRYVAELEAGVAKLTEREFGLISAVAFGLLVDGSGS